MNAVIAKKDMQPVQPQTQTFEWSRPPREVNLAAGQVHIWKIALDKVFSPEVISILSADELQRSLRLISPLKRARFQSARSTLRMILSAYLGQTPQSIHFSYSPEGKPSVKSSPMEGKLEFNIAHSENLMLAAFTTCGPIGIDLEYKQSVSAATNIVGQFFSEQDQIAFHNIPEEKKQSAFLSAWVQKEAYGKALGTGLATASQRNHFSSATLTPLPTNQHEVFREEETYFIRFCAHAQFSASSVVMKSKKTPQFSFWKFLRTTEK